MPTTTYKADNFELEIMDYASTYYAWDGARRRACGAQPVSMRTFLSVLSTQDLLENGTTTLFNVFEEINRCPPVRSGRPVRSARPTGPGPQRR
ncbi:unnamed protein product [Rotaria magnacalcarata]|uniref:Uncharacterized protein n=1 Tax=Rotaria magnacalcarata TaxID=392030 RepID=A0A819PHA4_9BILA|nr:unnamed protein product [Rotaria magnacalcarata]CAF2125247.1 unnamed protein product [Rotaria magnacalcarata]CAF3934463.1 unnamed protein product [Rotaria magnacalcarata]CAF4017183.1 unnamed protein product [Rotaria magnacalcarata]